MPPVFDSARGSTAPNGSLTTVEGEAENARGIQQIPEFTEKLTRPKPTVSPGVKVTPLEAIEKLSEALTVCPSGLIFNKMFGPNNELPPKIYGLLVPVVTSRNVISAAPADISNENPATKSWSSGPVPVLVKITSKVVGIPRSAEFGAISMSNPA